MAVSGLVFLSTVLLFLPGVCFACDVQTIRTCENQFASDVGISFQDLEAGLVTDTTRNGLNSVCSAYENFKICVSSYRGYCPTGVRVTLEGLEALYDYTCGEGFEKHLLYASCVDQDPTLSAIEDCNTALFRDQDTFFIDENKFCSIMKKNLNCIEREVERGCGKDASRHQITIERKFLGPFAEEIGCDLDGSNTSLIIGIVVGILVSLLVIIAVIVVVCCLINRNKRQMVQQTQLQNQPMTVVNPGGAYPGAVGTAPPAYDYHDPNIWQEKKPPLYETPHVNGVRPPSERDSHVYTDARSMGVPPSATGYDNNAYESVQKKY